MSGQDGGRWPRAGHVASGGHDADRWLRPAMGNPRWPRFSVRCPVSGHDGWPLAMCWPRRKRWPWTPRVAKVRCPVSVHVGGRWPGRWPVIWLWTARATPQGSTCPQRRILHAPLPPPGQSTRGRTTVEKPDVVLRFGRSRKQGCCRRSAPAPCRPGRVERGHEPLKRLILRRGSRLWSKGFP